MGNEHLSGTIPDELVNMRSLVEFSVDSTGLSGNVPDQIGSLQHLERIYFHCSPGMEGELPASICQNTAWVLWCSTLQTDITNNPSCATKCNTYTNCRA